MKLVSTLPDLHPMRAVRRRLLGVAIAAAMLALLMGASSAFGAVVWSPIAEHGPEHVAPGGKAQYVIQAYNVGNANTSQSYTVTVNLPAGVTATDLGTSSSGWACNLPANIVVCRHAGTGGNRVLSPGMDLGKRNLSHLLMLTVDVDGSTALGTADAVVRFDGGGAGAVSGTFADATTFALDPVGFGFRSGSFRGDVFDDLAPAGAAFRQAAGHPFEARIDFDMNLKLGEDPDNPVLGDLFYTQPVETIKTLETKLPPGLIGNPEATPRCDPLLLNSVGPRGKGGSCPANTQVGTIDLFTSAGMAYSTPNDLADLPVFNLEPAAGRVAELGISVVGQPVKIEVELDPSDHYAVVAKIPLTTEFQSVRRARLSLWGVPADPAHDALRADPATGLFGTPFDGPEIKPFLTMPSLCGVPGAIEMRADSWDDAGDFTPWQVGETGVMSGCDDVRFSFEPTISLQPEKLTPSTPTGVDVDIAVPQKDDSVADATLLYPQSADAAAIATPPLLNATVVLPEGMSVSPSSADGLGACTPLQIGLGTNDDPTCPDASKLGTVSIETPLLPEPLRGSVHLASQTDNPFGSLLALYIVAKGPGVMIKLPGRVATDPVTGRLTATFLENPPLPFSHLHLHFKGGPRAPLVTPATCGEKTTTADLSSWNVALPAVHTTSSFTIAGDCDRGFDPGFTAGTKNAVAGTPSPLVTRFTRGDRDEELSTMDISLPQGLLGKVADLDLCADAAANAGTCANSARIGTAVVGAGPGSNPFYITDGRVYMTGPYKGAPFGLSIVVHARAGPLDLGDVVVRAAVFVDKQTAALRIVSDPMPTILQGIPLQIRVVDITVDRPGFMLNPTNCTEMSSSATLGSAGGKKATKGSRFQVDGCAALPFAPKLALTIGGRGAKLGRGASTPLTATLTMPPGGANLRGVRVVLPTTINARLNVINRACTLDQFHSGNCEQARAGTATAVTPLLRDPLVGGVYFVRNGRPLPDMMVALRGQVDIDLDSRIAIPHSKFLSTQFVGIPDVPVTSFTLRFVAGSHGPVGAATGLCKASSRRAKAGIAFTAQSGKVVRKAQRVTIAGCKKHRRAK